MSNSKRRQHAAEAFLSRMGTKGTNEQEHADASEQTSGSPNKQTSADPNGQTSASTQTQDNNNANQQNGSETNMQTSNETNKQDDKSANRQNSKIEKMRRITFNIPESLYKKLKWISVQEDITMLDIGAAMAREYIEKRNNKQ